MLGYVVLWALLLNSVSDARTPLPVCGQYEEWSQCAHSCPLTCDRLGERFCCDFQCVQGCTCVNGRIRDHNTKCVLVDDCPSPGVVRFEQLELTVFEGSKVAKLTVKRVKGSHGRITVHWRVRETSHKPYSDLTGLLIFEDEVVLQIINIPITDNDFRNPDIILNIELFEPSKKVEVEPRRGVSKVIIKDDDMRPGYPEMESLSVSVSESAREVSVRVVRIDGTDGRITASWKTVAGTAESGSDFISDSGKVVFEDGIKERFIKIKIKDDETREEREEFRVELYEPTAGAGVLNFRARGSRLITLVNIEDDDMTPGYPEMETTVVRVSEGDGRVLIRVVRRDGSDGTIFVRYNITQGTAVPFLDYIPDTTGGRLEFKNGVTEQTITVQLVDDGLREKEESFRVELFEPEAGPGVIKFRARGTSMMTEVIVTDDDMTCGVLELERDTYSVTERVEALRIWVHRVDGSDGVVSVHWRTVAGVAVATKDFVHAEGELVFLEGETRKSILVHIVDDSSKEGTEIFHVEIFDAKPGPGVLNFKGLGNIKRTDIIIHDDDMTPGQLVLEPATLEVLENVGTVRLSVIRKDGTDGQVRVHWRTVGDGGYFLAGSGELVFEEGDTKRVITIHIINNDVRNREERLFEVRLFDPTAGPGVVNFRGLGRIAKAVIHVKDDETAAGQLELEESTFSVVEGVPTVSAGVNRVGGTDGRIIVHWRTVSILATFVTVSGQIVFEDGETRQMIHIQRPAGDFEIELFDPTPAVVHFRGLAGNRASTAVRLSRFFGVLEIEQPSYTVTEAGGSVSIGIERNNGDEGEVRVRFRTVAITAEDGKDFVGAAGELVFHPKQHLQFISIRILDDNVHEPQETFALELIQVTTSTVGVVDFNGMGRVVRTEITITDDDVAAEPTIFFVNTTLEVPRNSESVLFLIGRSDDGSDQPIQFFIETLHYNGDSSAISNVDFKNTRGLLTFVANHVMVTSSVKILPNPNNRMPFKVFLVRISQPSIGRVIPGKDVLMVILRDVEALFLKGQVEVTANVKTEVQPPQPPPPPEFRGGQTKEVIAHTCPAGLTFKECQPSCQKKCDGIVVPRPCHITCVKGCFCPTGMWLIEETMKCVTTCPVSKCPFGMTFKECERACPETCPGLDFLDQNPSCHGGGCIKGCYCPVGKVLDHTLKNCVSPTQCSGGQQGLLSPRGFQFQSGFSGIQNGVQGQVQSGLQSQIQGQVQGIVPRGLPIGGQGQIQGQAQGQVQGRVLPIGGLQSQVQGAVQGGGLLGGIGGGLLGG